MAIKHQMYCFRVIKGKKFINFCDIRSEKDESFIDACKLHKIPHRVFKHPDGFRRLFVREDKAELLT